MKKLKALEKNKEEIFYILINSLLSAGIAILGALSTGKITFDSLMTALLVGLGVLLIQFKNYWESEREEYIKKKVHLFKFI